MKCPSGATRLAADYCFGELAERVGLEQSGPYHHLIEN